MDKCICDIHVGEEKLIDEGSLPNLYISRNSSGYYIEVKCDGKARKKINYCPECGRKLDENADKSCSTCKFHESFIEEDDDWCVCNHEEGNKMYHTYNCNEYIANSKGCPYWE